MAKMVKKRMATVKKMRKTMKMKMITMMMLWTMKMTEISQKYELDSRRLFHCLNV